jgi:hypothetical protein
MALLWADSFDHYGTSPNGGRDAMLLGAWAAFDAGSGTKPYIDGSFPRTGSYALRFDHNYLATAGTRGRRVFGSSLTTVGVGFGYYFPALPPDNNRCAFAFRDVGNNNLIDCYVQTDGSIEVKVAGVSIGTTDAIITATSYHHIEIKAVLDPIVGSVEIRVNGQVEFYLDNIDTGSTATTQFAIGTFTSGGSLSYTFYVDDMFAWDGTGTEFNDFQGTQRVTTIFPVADTAQADWTPTGAASGYDCIDDTVPDGDTTYILGTNANDISEFDLDTLPPETEEIAGVFIPTLAKLDDAGTGEIQVSLVSGGVPSSGPSQVLTPGYAYWGSSHPVDPDTGVAWTKAGLEAAILRVEKTL